jgi:hypothetical protein
MLVPKWIRPSALPDPLPASKVTETSWSFLSGHGKARGVARGFAHSERYLGTQPAKESVLRAERLCESSGGTSSEAEEAINRREHECIALKAALSEHPLAPKTT